MKYARLRMIAGAAIGIVMTLAVGYAWACYKHQIALTAGLAVFRYPIIGIGLIFLSFCGAVIGALASLFTKKWKEKASL